MHNYEFLLIFMNSNYFAEEGWLAHILSACGLWLYLLMTWVMLKSKFAGFSQKDLHGLCCLVNNCLLSEGLKFTYYIVV